MLDIFPYISYISDYQDLKNYTKEEAIEHWINFGFKEGRKINLDTFPYENYISNYDDLKHFNLNEAYYHYLLFGEKEGRSLSDINLINYNYNAYLSFYRDLQNLSREEAFNHWKNNGKNEGRIASVKKINFTSNIVILIHLFQTELLNEFLVYIENVKKIFNKVVVIFTISENSNFEKKIKKYNPDFFVINVENKGVDIYPFLICINFLRNNNIKADFILKMHSKMTSNNTEGLINWRKELIEPITNIQNLISLQHYFLNIENLGYVGAQKCVLPKNYDLDFPANIEGLKQLIEKFPYLEKDWTDFNGGNIFWINNNVLNKYLKDDLIDYIINNVCNSKPPCNLTDKGIYIEYLCERLFTGVFCYDSTNILVSDYSGTQRGIGVTNGIVNNEYFNQNRVFSFYKPKEIINYIK